MTGVELVSWSSVLGIELFFSKWFGACRNVAEAAKIRAMIEQNSCVCEYCSQASASLYAEMILAK